MIVAALSWHSRKIAELKGSMSWSCSLGFELEAC